MHDKTIEHLKAEIDALERSSHQLKDAMSDKGKRFFSCKAISSIAHEYHKLRQHPILLLVLHASFYSTA